MALLQFSCGSEEESVPAEPNDMVEDMIPDATQTGMGTFTTYAHNLSGTATLLLDNTGNKIVRLEDFNMTAGPDVYVFISRSNNYSKANVVEVARLTLGYTDSDININLTTSSTAITSEHKFILVYCLQFNSLFGYAELK
jgi:hypothetical protein